MARYSAIQDVTDPNFQNMGEEFHQEAADYINRELINPSGYAEGEISDTVAGFSLLKSISVNYAKYLYCMQSMKQEGDAWALRMVEFRRMFLAAQRQFHPQLLLVSSQEDAGYRKPYGSGIDLYRG